MSFKVGDRVRVGRGGFDEGLGTIVEYDGHAIWPYEVELDSRKAEGIPLLAVCSPDELTRVGDFDRA